MIVDKAVYVGGRRFACGDAAAELERLEDTEDGFLWIGLQNPTEGEFYAMNAQLHLHPLAVEDAVKGNQRPKVDFYEGSIFVVLKTLRYIEQTSDVETGELMIFVGDRFVLTVRKGEANPLAGVRLHLEERPDRLALGPLAVLHAVVDHIVDSYREVDGDLAADLEAIEKVVFAQDRSVRSADIYKLKREVLEFKRGAFPLLVPLRRLVSGDEKHIVPEQLRPFYTDVLDHVLQAADHSDTYDRLLSDILATHLAQVSVRQNDDMRRISAWVAIAAVPTMIAGVYGMNFDYMPELHAPYGYFVVVGVMVSICVVLYVLFRRSGWL